MHPSATLLQFWILGSCMFSQTSASIEIADFDSSERNMEYLFGGSKPWNSSVLVWKAVTDQVRGGSSQSFLEPVKTSSAKFRGVLDTKTLGGAGFASQSTKATSVDGSDVEEPVWDLSSYGGLLVGISSIDSKVYTITIKDDLPDGKRDDGREQSGVAWEADFKLGSKDELKMSSQILPVTEVDDDKDRDARYLVEVPWKQFRATYRGRDKPDAKPLQTVNIRRFGLMMRSFFEKQEGDFEVIIEYIAVYRSTDGLIAKLSL